MQGFQAAAFPRLDLDRINLLSLRDDVIHFGIVRPALAEPVVQTGRLPAFPDVQQVLPDKLLGQPAFVDQRGFRKLLNRIPFQSENMAGQSHIEKDQLEALLIRFRIQRDAIAVTAHHRVADTRFGQQIDDVTDLIRAGTWIVMAEFRFPGQMAGDSGKDSLKAEQFFLGSIFVKVLPMQSDAGKVFANGFFDTGMHASTIQICIARPEKCSGQGRGGTGDLDRAVHFDQLGDGHKFEALGLEGIERARHGGDRRRVDVMGEHNVARLGVFDDVRGDS
jgi:hypothetical protein